MYFEVIPASPANNWATLGWGTWIILLALSNAWSFTPPTIIGISTSASIVVVAFIILIPEDANLFIYWAVLFPVKIAAS